MGGFCLFLFAVLLSVTECFPGGAPPTACVNVAPNPAAAGGHNADPQTSTVPYALTGLPPNGNYTPGMSYTLTLAGSANEMFRGYLVVATNGSQRVGSFTPDANGQVACDDNLGVTHINRNDKTTVSFTWTAPAAGTGEVEFRFSVVMVQQTYWANQLAMQEGPSDGSAAYTSQGTLALILLALLSLAMMLGF